MSEKIFHIVIRFSDNLFSVGDVVAKHNAVVENNGYVWFGKMGSPISQGRMDLLNTQIAKNTPTFVYFVKGIRNKSTFYRADVLAISREINLSEKEAIPKYYQEKELTQFMKTWLKILEISQIEESAMSTLKTTSSIFRLQDTLVRSSSGYFFVHESKNLYF